LKLRFSYFSFLFFVSFCATSYNKKIQEVENSFYRQDFDSAIPAVRSLAESSDEADKLLYLLEAGTVFHTKGDYLTSNKVFKQAEEIADRTKTSATGETLAFLSNDGVTTFQGESFEKVLIKVYISINYLLLGESENAKRYFKKVDFELKDMKVNDSKYKQNLFARYLDAIVSEQLGAYNDARVSYKNIMEIAPDNREIYADRYVLAVKEGDSRDQQKYAEGKTNVKAFNASISPIDYTRDLAEVIIINQAGKSATKESKGKLIDEPIIKRALTDAIELSLRMESKEGVTVTGVMAGVAAFAENPIPEYKKREENHALPSEVLINGKSIGQTRIYNDYSDIAVSSFNENYSTYVTKHIASISTKLILAAAATYATSKGIEKQFEDKNGRGGGVIGLIANLVLGLLAGATVSSSIKPDLRCWRTLPANYQIKRIFLEPGTYSFEFKSGDSKVLGSQNFQNILIEKGKPTFINFRSL
jgi:uncharacterized protein